MVPYRPSLQHLVVSSPTYCLLLLLFSTAQPGLSHSDYIVEACFRFFWVREFIVITSFRYGTHQRIFLLVGGNLLRGLSLSRSRREVVNEVMVASNTISSEVIYLRSSLVLFCFGRTLVDLVSFC